MESARSRVRFMERLKVGVDVDEVVADFMSAFIEEAQIVLHRQLPRAAAMWDGQSQVLSQAEIDKVWDHILATPDWFYLNLSSLPGVTKCLPWLTRMNEVYFITARVQTAGLPVDVQTQMALSDMGVEFPQVIVTKDKGLVAKALKLDVFIDDKVTNLERIAERSPDTQLYFMRGSYLTEPELPRDCTSVSNFEEFCNAIGKE